MPSQCQRVTRSQTGMRRSLGTPPRFVSSTSHYKNSHTGHEIADSTNHIQRLPAEILYTVLKLVVDRSGDEPWVHYKARYDSVVLACKDWAVIASNIWWKTRAYIFPEAEPPLASLARLPLERQQWYANKIQHLDLNGTNAADFIAALKLSFPSLRTLEIGEWSHHEVGFLCLASQFIRQSLLELKLSRTYRVDDVLTALLNASNLRTLELWCEIPLATSDELLKVVRSCLQLRVLVLAWTIEPIINKDVLAAIASLPYLQSLHLISYGLTLEVSNHVLAANSSPFCSITRLNLGMFHSAAINILSGISTLKFLSLRVIGDAPILHVLATLCNLQELVLRFRDSVAVGYLEWLHLTTLKDLRRIEISSWDGFGFSQVDLSSITTDEFMSFFQALPQLSSIWINAAISNTAQVYIQAGEICRNLKSLSLRGQFDSSMLLESHTGEYPLYPMLESLSVHQFIEPQDKRTR
jgi:hypothetical protein